MGKRLKVVKNSIIRQLALWICFFYIINPIHKPLSDVLHSLTHNFTVPYFVAGHQTIESHENKIHNPHAHEGTDTVHDHSILNTISTIFEAFNNHDNENDSQVGMLLMDKHFLAEKISFVLLNIQLKSNPHGGFKIELLRGHWLTFLRPPIPEFLQDKIFFETTSTDFIIKDQELLKLWIFDFPRYAVSHPEGPERPGIILCLHETIA